MLLVNVVLYCVLLARPVALGGDAALLRGAHEAQRLTAYTRL